MERAPPWTPPADRPDPWTCRRCRRTFTIDNPGRTVALVREGKARRAVVECEACATNPLSPAIGDPEDAAA